MANNIAAALVLCDVDADMNNIIWNGSLTSARLAGEIFDDSWETFMDITYEELDSHWSTYSALTVADGKIRLRPPTKTKIKALVQWVRDQFRTSLDPSLSPFPVGDRTILVKRYHTHKQWVKDSKNMLETALPKNFTDKMKWQDWKNTFLSFLRTQPGRFGVPLSYICRDNENPLVRVNADFLDDYVDQAPLNGDGYIMDNLKVHTLLRRLVTDHTVAEQKLLATKDQADGRADFIILKAFYEGVGANSKSLAAAEKDINDLFYLGEKKPHMWWDEFEARLTNAFATIDKDAGRAVHTDTAKLRMLNNKIRADFLVNMKTNIQMRMNEVPMTMTYDSALTNYRNTVSAKFPDDPAAHKSKGRKIQATITSKSSSKNNDKKNSNGKRNNDSNRSSINQNHNHKYMHGKLLALTVRPF